MKATKATHIAIILDRSGSMQSCRASTESGVEELIASQRRTTEALGEVCSVSLYQFDDQFDVVFENQDIHTIGKISLLPRGMTALYDAIGKTVSRLKSSISTSMFKPSKVIVVILTDGAENASLEYTSARIKTLIEESGFEFIFLGANQDAILTASTMGINANSSLTYTVQNTGQVLNSASAYMTSTRSCGVASFTDEDRYAATK